MSATAIPFAGLAPDARRLRGFGDLERFDLVAAVRLGAQLRRAGPARSTAADVAERLADEMNAYEHHARPAFALLGVFALTRCSALEPAALAALTRRRGAAPRPDAPALRLLAARGAEPQLNRVEGAREHPALLYGGDDDPMMLELARQLRLSDPAAAPAAAFLVTDALENPATASDFVRANGIQSVAGFGVRISAELSCAVLGFSRAAITRAIVEHFAVVALYARLAWLEGDEPRAVAARDDLIDALGVHLEETFKATAQQLAGVQAEASLANARATELAAQRVREQQRVHRAMLNVVDDLREARAALQVKVEARTRELSIANRQLDARNRELEEFVYIASHDLQEPLRTVAGYLQMIERRYVGKLGTEGDEFIRYAIDGAGRMQQLIQSLLAYSRVGTAEHQLGTVKLDETLDLTLKNLAASISEKQAVIERGPLPQVHGDPVQLVQVFQNLVSNALKFSGPRAPRVFVTGGVDEGLAWVSVRDEGVGFNPKFADRIFKIFRRLRRDTPGTGIGLAVCKKIIERHGGHIEVTAAPDQGATFTVKLPAEGKTT
ncbi:MAG: hypothetical protein IPJ65_29250 [Archangiaceae bacterium]|nr:hypothetical protein [Archangiaceae bacterium]